MATKNTKRHEKESGSPAGCSGHQHAAFNSQPFLMEGRPMERTNCSRLSGQTSARYLGVLGAFVFAVGICASNAGCLATKQREDLTLKFMQDVATRLDQNTSLVSKLAQDIDSKNVAAQGSLTYINVQGRGFAQGRGVSKEGLTAPLRDDGSLPPESGGALTVSGSATTVTVSVGGTATAPQTVTSTPTTTQSGESDQTGSGSGTGTGTQTSGPKTQTPTNENALNAPIAPGGNATGNANTGGGGGTATAPPSE